MGRLLIWMHLLLLTVLLASVQKAAACSCSQAHPQTKFCESDFGTTVISHSITSFILDIINIIYFVILYYYEKYKL